MADKDIKLKATIEGDSKGLQSALNDAQRSATSASKNIKNSVEGVKGSFNNAGASARDMGETASKAGMTIGDAMRHPIEAVKTLIAKLNEASGSMRKLGEAGKQTGQQTGGGISNMLGGFTKLALKLKIITKAFEIIRDKFFQYVVDPARNHFKEVEERALTFQKNAENMRGEHSTERQTKTNALTDFYEKYKAARDTGTEESKTRLRQAHERLAKVHGIEIDLGENVLKQVTGALSKVSKDYVEMLESQKKQLEGAVGLQRKAISRHESDYTYVASFIKQHGGGAEGKQQWEQENKRLHEELSSMLTDYSATIVALDQAMTDTTARDFREIERAREMDKLAGKDSATLADRKRQEAEAQKQAEAEAKARLETEKARQKATEALDKWASDLMDDESKKRLDEAYDKYASLVEQGVSEELAKPILDEAIRQELTKTVEKEAEARKKLVEEYTRQRENLKSAYERQTQAQQALTDAQKRLADLQKQQAEDARLERIGRKRGKIATRLARFGFQLGNVNPNETTRQHNARIRTAKLDSSIRQKLAKQEAGGRVHYTTREKARMGEYRRLEKQDKRLNREEQAILAARKQVSASEALKSASDAINTAADNLQQATKGVETQRATTLQARNEAQAQAQKETEAKARAEKGYERGAKYSEKATKEQEAQPQKPEAPEKQAPKEQEAQPPKQQEPEKQAPKDAKPAIKKPESNVQPLVEAINRLYAPPREWIAKKGEKDQSNAILRGIQKALEKQSKKFYVVK